MDRGGIQTLALGSQIQVMEKRQRCLTGPGKRCCSTTRMLKQLERLIGLLRGHFLTLQMVFVQPDLP
ncbi:hypothetical protein D3C73_984300 [compost metagenome]